MKIFGGILVVLGILSINILKHQVKLGEYDPGVAVAGAGLIVIGILIILS